MYETLFQVSEQRECGTYVCVFDFCVCPLLWEADVFAFSVMCGTRQQHSFSKHHDVTQRGRFICIFFQRKHQMKIA